MDDHEDHTMACLEGEVHKGKWWGREELAGDQGADRGIAKLCSM